MYATECVLPLSVLDDTEWQKNAVCCVEPFSMAKKSYNQLKLLNLVTMATTKILSKPFFMLIIW